MSDAEAIYAARIAYPQYLQRDREQVVRLEVHLGRGLAEPASGTYALRDRNGAELAAGAVTVVRQVATYTVPASALPATLGLGQGYVEVWTLVMPDGSTRTFERDAVVVRSALYPVVTDQDMIDVYSDLERLRPSRLDSFATYRIEAWKRILGRLEIRGNLPNLITTPWSLREVHLELSLHLCAADQKTGRDGKWASIAEDHKREFELGWQRMKFKYAAEDGGDAGALVSPEATLFSTAPPSTSWEW